MTENFRLFFGRWFGIVILAVLAGLIIWFLLNFNFILDKFQNKLFATDAEKELRRLENLYKNDKYGGKTPEETFDLFIDALKKGDIELASKYFVLNKQDDWEKTLEEYKLKGLISDFVVELEKNKNNWELRENNGQTANFNYSYTVEKSFIEELPLGNGKTQKITHPAGEFNSEINFEKYPSGVWKISLL